jgi:hypothetical protein
VYPFFYFPSLQFNPDKILDFINQVPDVFWKGPDVSEYLDVPKKEHIADDKLWTLHHSDYDLLRCEDIKKLVEPFYIKNRPLFYQISIKKSKNGFRSPFHPLLQHPEIDKKIGIKRTWDIIVPIQGGFIESPLEAIDTRTNEKHILVPKGQAFLVPVDDYWHYSWKETKYDFRYTVHIRGKLPTTYEGMKKYAS